MARRRGSARRVGGGGFGRGAARLIGRDFLPFQPYKPPPVPSGSYDPTLDAQLGQSQRGLGDLKQDTESLNTRDTVDYGTQLGNLNQQITQLHTDYEQLGGRQQESANQAGVISGGAMLQAAQKRAANEAHDRVPLDQAKQQLAIDYAPPSAGSPLGGRRFQDRTTALTRAQREGAQFGIDVNSEKQFQASQVGYVPPGRGEPGGMPRNETVNGQGVHTRTIRSGGHVYVVDQTGRVIRRRPRSGYAQAVGSGYGAGARF